MGSTTKRYMELEDQWFHRDEPYMFYAFSKEQFEQGKEKITKNGWLSQDEKVVTIGAGGFTSHRGYKQLIKDVSNHYSAIRKECDPQDVYDYEHDNHECKISMDGDIEAIRIVATIYGDEIARTVKRRNACYSIDEI